MSPQITQAEYDALMAELAKHAPRQPAKTETQPYKTRLVRDAPGVPTFLALLLIAWPLIVMNMGVWGHTAGWVIEWAWVAVLGLYGLGVWLEKRKS
jgi:hypothetical protein